jgi:hypothetical protein
VTALECSNLLEISRKFQSKGNVVEKEAAGAGAFPKRSSRIHVNVNNLGTVALAAVSTVWILFSNNFFVASTR